jgi:hypothetical protein
MRVTRATDVIRPTRCSGPLAANGAPRGHALPSPAIDAGSRSWLRLLRVPAAGSARLPAQRPLRHRCI